MTSADPHIASLTLNVIVAYLVLGIVSAKPKYTIHGAGASFPNEVYQSWSVIYSSKRLEYVDLEITYDAIGSGSGKKRIMGKDKGGAKVYYAGSDSLLSEEEKANFPNLKMFPTMAGAVVIGYNLPGMDDRLVLSMPILAGIYNGSITNWNNSLVADLNKNAVLPDEHIIVLAREDSSGTTHIYTSGLSTNPIWNDNFGAFSAGMVDSQWPNDTITYYAHKNRGMSGLITSFRYSVGYLSISDANDAGMTSAYIKTKQGTIVEANTATVQSAMDEAAKYLATVSDDLTTSLVQFSTKDSYPIAGLTYMIVPIESTQDCDARIELVRYIDWFITSELAHDVCIKNSMTPLSDNLAKLVRERITTKITCRKENLWEKAQKQISLEVAEDKTLLITVITVLVSLMILGGGAVGGFYLIRQFRFQKKLRKRDWAVNIEDILFYQTVSSADEEDNRFVMWPSLTSLTEVDQVDDGFMMMEHVLHWPGKWQGIIIGLRLMSIKNLKISRQSLQTTLLWLRELNHTNVLNFHGITSVDTEYFTVNDYCSKGCLTDLLKDKKLNLNNDFKFSLSSDIASGLLYLSSKQIVHGHLKSTNCLLDLKWTVQISDWEFCRLYQEMDKSKCPLSIVHHSPEQLCCNDAAMQEFWTSPEILKSDFTQHYTFQSDMYSFGIVLFEIFAREAPYEEHLDMMPATDILKAIKNNHLRPRDDDMTPNSVRMIMDMIWFEDPEKRPTIDRVAKLLRDAHVIKKSVVDVMLELTEDCTNGLKAEIKSIKKKLRATEQMLSLMIKHNIPSPFIQYVDDKLAYPNRSYCSTNLQRAITKPASILCVQCTSEKNSARQLALYNNLDLVLANLVHTYGGNRVDIAVGVFLVIFFDPEPTVALSGSSSTSRHLSGSDNQCSLSVISTPFSNPCIGEIKMGTESFRTHAEAAAALSLDLIQCMNGLFIATDGQILGGFLVAIHSGPVDMCLLDHGIPRCLYYGTALDIVRVLVTRSALEKVLVSGTFKGVLHEDGDLSYDFEPNGKTNGRTPTTFWLSKKQAVVNAGKPDLSIPIFV